MAELSTKPYLIRAIHQWCEDSGYRPYLAVMVDERTQVPREFVRNGEIVLNVSAVATNRLQLGNDLIEFEARFSGSVRQVSIPIENVSAIYAQETGHGMAFDVPKPLALAPARAAPTLAVSEPATAAPPLSSPVAGSAPVLQAVDSALPPGRTPRSAAPKARRRGKLSAVPDGAPAGSDISLRPVDAATEPSQAPAAPLPAGAETTPAGGPNASSSTGSAPDEPPPSPPVRPQLKRIK